MDWDKIKIVSMQPYSSIDTKPFKHARFPGQEEERNKDFAQKDRMVLTLDLPVDIALQLQKQITIPSTLRSRRKADGFSIVLSSDVCVVKDHDKSKIYESLAQAIEAHQEDLGIRLTKED